MKPDRNRLRILVVAGGAIGTLLRFASTEFVAQGTRFPWATLLVNVIGSVGLGYLVGRSLSRTVPMARLAFVGVGAMGALTTFGAVMVQVVALIESGSVGLAITYLVASVLLCLAGALATLRLGTIR